ncbi:MAG: TolC family protein [Sphingobacteriaceae bacterium]
MLLLQNCKIKEPLMESSQKKLPAKFDQQSDSLRTEPEKWRNFYFDANLKSLIDSALLNNLDLKNAIQKIEYAKANVRMNKGVRLPEVGINSSIGQRKFGDYTMDGVGNYDTQFSPNITDKQRIPNPLPDYYVGFQASWEIDLWGKLKNKKRAAAEKFIASVHGRDLIITGLISEIANHYFDLLAFDNEYEILTSNILLQEAALELVKSQKNAAKANQLDVEMQESQLLNTKGLKKDIEQKIVVCISKLNYLCGAFPRDLQRDTAYYADHLKPKINAGLPSDLLQNRPDIKQAEALLRSSNADVISAKAAFYPSVSLGAMFGLQSFNSALLFELPASAAYNLMGGLTTPLLNRRKLKAELMATRSEQKQAFINYEKTILNGFMEVFVANKNVNNLAELFELKKQEVNILKSSISTSKDLFSAGRISYLEVIIAQKNALMTELELAEIQKKCNLSKVELYRALGGGWKN